MNKNIIVAGTITGILLFVPQNTADLPANAEEQASVQTLTMPRTNLIKNLEIRSNFERGTYKIVETRPWLKKENQSKRLSEKELRSILNKAGFSGNGLEMAIKIAFYESTFRPYAFNKSSNCYGLFQINMTGSMGPDRREKYGLSKNEDLFNPIINASVAYKMSNGGKNWSAWTTESLAKANLND